MPDEELCQVSPKSHNVLKRCNQTPALMRSFLEPLLFLTNIPLPASKFASCFGNYCHRTIVGHEPLTNLHYILNPPHIGLRKVHCPSVLWEMRRNTLAALVAQNLEEEEEHACDPPATVLPPLYLLSRHSNAFPSEIKISPATY